VLIRFDAHDLAVLRICARNGWSIERDWWGLSERERNEWLAYDVWRQRRLELYRTAVVKAEYVDAGSLTALLIAETL
jgi:hypothetical protein